MIFKNTYINTIKARLTSPEKEGESAVISEKHTVPFPFPTEKELKCECLIDDVTDQVSMSMANIN